MREEIASYVRRNSLLNTPIAFSHTYMNYCQPFPLFSANHCTSSIKLVIKSLKKYQTDSMGEKDCTSGQLYSWTEYILNEFADCRCFIAQTLCHSLKHICAYKVVAITGLSHVERSTLLIIPRSISSVIPLHVRWDIILSLLYEFRFACVNSVYTV